MSIPHLNGVMLIDGSSSAPALAFNSDTNTGIYRSQDDRINISVGGTNMFHVDSAGITSAVNVYSGTNGQFRNYAGVWKGTTGQSGGDAQFILNGKTIMHIDEADENVGIGTTAPSEKLHIADSGNPKILIQDTSADNQAGIRFKTTNYEWSAGLHGGENAFKISNHHSFGTNDFLTVKTTGFVGIGTITPERKLSVTNSTIVSSVFRGTSSGGHLIDLRHTNSADGYNGFRFYDEDTNRMNLTHIQTGTRGYVQIGNDWAAGSEILVVDGDNERVGIGTSSPSTQLHLASDTGPRITLEDTDPSIGIDSIIADISFVGTEIGGETARIGAVSETTGGEAGLRFYTGSSVTQALKLDKDQNATFAGSITGKDSGIIIDSLSGPYGRIHGTSSIFLGGVSTSLVQLSANLIPDGDSARDLGASNRYWRDAYIDTITTNGNITLGANYIGRDGDNYIGFVTDNLIKFRVNGATQVKLSDGLFAPQTDSDVDLGSNNVRFANIYADTLYGDGSNITGVTATDSTKLPLTGGTLTGNLQIDTAASNSIGTGIVLNRPAAGTHYHGLHFSTNGTCNWSVGQNSNDSFQVYEEGANAKTRFTIAQGGNATFSGSVTADTMVINDTDGTRGIFRDNASYDLRLGGGVDKADGAYISLSGGLRGGGTSTAKGRVEIFAGGNNYTAQSQITGDIVIGAHWDSGDQTILHLDSSNSAANFHGSVTFLGASHNVSVTSGTNIRGSNHLFLQGDASYVQIKSPNNYIYYDAVSHNFRKEDGTANRLVIDATDATFSGNVKLNSNSTVVAARKFTARDSNGVMLTADDATSGLSIADNGNATFTNNVVIGGDLTITGDINTETVNNLDVVDKLITVGKGQTEANSNGSGILVDGSNASLLWDETNNTWDFNKSLDVVGNINASGNLTAGGDILVNTTTSGGYIQIDHSDDSLKLADANKLKIGTGNDLQIFHDGSVSKVENYTGNLTIQQRADNSDIVFQCDDGSGGITDYFRIDGGYGSPQTIFPDNSQLNFGNGLDLRIIHDGTDSRIESNGTGDLIIQQKNNDKDIVFKCDDGSGGVANYLKIDGGSENVQFNKPAFLYDNVALNIGNSFDLRLYHNGSNSIIQAQGTGNLIIQQNVDDGDIVFKSDDGDGGAAEYFKLDGSAATHDGSETTALYTNWPDKSYISLGDGHDFVLKHNGAQSMIHNFTGHLYMINYQDDGDISFQSDDGSGGFTEYFRLDGGDVRTIASKPFRFIDTIAAEFGTGLDMQIYHSGSTGYIENNTGHFQIIQQVDDKDIIFKSDDGSGGTTEYFRVDGGATDVRFSKNTRHFDNVRAEFGSSGNFIIKHDGTDSLIQAGSSGGNLTLQVAEDDHDMIFRCDNGSGGIMDYFRLDGSDVRININARMQFMDDVKASFGTSGDLQIYHDSSDSYISDVGTGNLYIKGGNEIRIVGDSAASDTIWAIFKASGTELWFDGNKKFETTNTGATLTGNLVMGSGQIKFADSGLVMLGDSNDLQIKHDGTNSEVSNLTGNLNIKSTATDGDISFYADNGSGGTTEYFRIDGGTERNIFSKDTQHGDGVSAYFGSSNDFRILHNGSHSFLTQNGTGDLRMVSAVADGDIKFEADDGSGSGSVTTYFKVDGGTEQVIFNKETEHQDSIKARFGNGGDLYIEHDGTDSKIINTNGDLSIQNQADDKDIIFKSDNGSGGVADYLIIDGSQVSIRMKRKTKWDDNIKATFGDGEDLEIYHDGSDSIIKDAGTGSLDILSSHVHLKSSGGTSNLAQFFSGGHSYIYANNVLRIEASTSGASITGDLTVTGNVLDRNIPMVIHASFDDTTSTTANRIIPLMGSIVETSVSGGYAPHFFTIPYACVLKRVIMKTVAGSQSSSFTTELKAYKNGAVTGNSSSGELTHSNSSITWDPTAHNDITYAAGDKFSLVYQKSATSKYWQDVAVTIVFTLTDYDI